MCEIREGPEPREGLSEMGCTSRSDNTCEAWGVV